VQLSLLIKFGLVAKHEDKSVNVGRRSVRARFFSFFLTVTISMGLNEKGLILILHCVAYIVAEPPKPNVKLFLNLT
jgi:hypothetical protein